MYLVFDCLAFLDLCQSKQLLEKLYSFLTHHDQQPLHETFHSILCFFSIENKEHYSNLTQLPALKISNSSPVFLHYFPHPNSQVMVLIPSSKMASSEILSSGYA